MSTLRREHADHLAPFRIPPDMLEAAGVRSVTDPDSRGTLGINSHRDADKAQLARELRRTQRTIDRLILRGDGPPFVQIGNKRLFRREAVLEWLLSRETPARQQSKTRTRRSAQGTGR